MCEGKEESIALIDRHERKQLQQQREDSAAERTSYTERSSISERRPTLLCFSPNPQMSLERKSLGFPYWLQNGEEGQKWRKGKSEL